MQRLSAAEIDATRELFARHDLLTPTTRFALLALAEPDKASVLGYRDGDPVDRRVRAVLLDVATGRSRTVLASLTRDSVDEVTDLTRRSMGSRRSCWRSSSRSTRSSRPTRAGCAAMARRGITDLDLVRPCPLSAGHFDIPGEAGRRMLRVLSFLQHRAEDHCWAHPIDGIVAYVDLTERRVVELIDDSAAAGAGRGGQLRRSGLRRAAPHHAEADRDHPAGRAELHCRR